MDGYEDDDTYHPRHDDEAKAADCLNCGACELCVERSIAAAEEHGDEPFGDEVLDAGAVELPTHDLGGEGG